MTINDKRSVSSCLPTQHIILVKIRVEPTLKLSSSRVELHVMGPHEHWNLDLEILTFIFVYRVSIANFLRNEGKYWALIVAKNKRIPGFERVNNLRNESFSELNDSPFTLEIFSSTLSWNLLRFFFFPVCEFSLSCLDILERFCRALFQIYTIHNCQ